MDTNPLAFDVNNAIVVDITNNMFSIIYSFIPFIWPLIWFYLLFYILNPFFNIFLNEFSSNNNDYINELNEIDNEIKEKQRKKRELKMSFKNSIDDKLIALNTSVNNKFKDLWEEFFLLRKSISIKKESENLVKIMNNKKYSNIHKLILSSKK